MLAKLQLRELRKPTSQSGLPHASRSTRVTATSEDTTRSGTNASSSTAASTRGRKPGSTRSVREATRTAVTSPRLATEARGGASAAIVAKTTVPAPSGCRALSTRTGILHATAGAIDAG
jgi:hypothetical protein